MMFREYIGAKAVYLCFAGILLIYIILTGCLIGASPILICFFSVFSLLTLLLILLLDWYRLNRRLKELKRKLEHLPEKYLVGEVLDYPKNRIEQEYFFLLKEVSHSAITAVEQVEKEREDYCNYVENWIHELKTPLTACSLIVSNDGGTGKIRRELKRADNLTDTILTYAKLRSIHNEIKIAKVCLSDVVRNAIQEEMILLIAAKISIQTHGDMEVFTDAKLMAGILKQLLVNCAKYCPGCKIQIRMDEDTLVVEDNGPGIPSYELPRVTERGFTGSGFSGSRTTGMGLYIVRQLCEQLSIALKIESEEGKYTCFSFHFINKI